MSLGNPELDALLERAKAAFDSLTPEEKAAHRREQYISFAYGQVKLAGSDITREQVAELYDQMVSKGELRTFRRSVWDRLTEDDDAP